MSAPRQKQRNVERDVPTVPTPLASDVIDAEFDDLDESDAEFTAWRWPNRNPTSEE